MTGASLPAAVVPCPWHQEAWHALQARAVSGLPHALLFTGEAGIGKRRFADAFAQWLLCTAPVAGLACGRCKACLLYAAGTHPDHQLVVPESMRPEAEGDGEAKGSGKKRANPSREIRIDDIRALIVFAAQTAQFGGRRVIVIDPAHAMNVNSANALLKTLEEPGEGTVLLLVSDAPAALPATIRSRCQLVRLPSPGRAEALAWLAPLAGGEAPAAALLAAVATPMRALALLGSDQDWVAQRRQLAKLFADVLCGEASAVRFAEVAAKAPESLLMDWLPSFLADGVRLAGGVPPASLRNGDLEADLRRVVEARTTQPLFLLGDDLSRLRQQFHAGAGLSRPLLWEEVMLRWSPRPRGGRQ